MFYSIVIGALTVFLLLACRAQGDLGRPGASRGIVEILVDMVADQAKGIVHSAESRRFVGLRSRRPCSWDLPDERDGSAAGRSAAAHLGRHVTGGGDPAHAYMRVVATADLSATLGMSTGVLLLCLYYNIKIKGCRRLGAELFTAPFGSHPLLYPINFAMQIIEFVAKTVSHGMRLFGNMYAGELIFILIALLGSTATVFGFLGHVIAGSIWAIFHILIITSRPSSS